MLPMGKQGVLTLAAVPIGRAEDASRRLAAELASATVIAAEDTRRVRWLAASLDIELQARLISYYDAVETRRTPGLLADLLAGQDVLLVTAPIFFRNDSRLRSTAARESPCVKPRFSAWPP